MSFYTAPPFTPQQRINQGFEAYPGALGKAYLIKALQNQQNQPIGPKPGGRVGWNPVAVNDAPPQGPVQVPLYRGGVNVTPQPKPPPQPFMNLYPNSPTWREHTQGSLGDGLFGVPPQHLQHLAGTVLPFPMSQAIPGDSLSAIARRLEMSTNPPPRGWLGADPDAFTSGLQTGKVTTLPRK